jgi:hypothetical protein
MFALLSILFVNTGYSQAKRQVTKSRQVWFTYQFQFPLKGKFSMVGDLGLRQHHGFAAPMQRLTRIGLSHPLGKGWDLQAGGAFFDTYSTTSAVRRQELRAWIRTFSVTPLGKGFQIQNRHCYEARWLEQTPSAEGLELAPLRLQHRFRYQTALQWKPANLKHLQFSIVEEILINFGNPIIYNFFDHNRFQVFTGYRWGNGWSMNAGYMWMYTQRSSGIAQESADALRLTLIYKPERKSLALKE